jgi:hypothetical protein
MCSNAKTRGQSQTRVPDQVLSATPKAPIVEQMQDA